MSGNGPAGDQRVLLPPCAPQSAGAAMGESFGAQDGNILTEAGFAPDLAAAGVVGAGAGEHLMPAAVGFTPPGSILHGPAETLDQRELLNYQRQGPSDAFAMLCVGPSHSLDQAGFRDCRIGVGGPPLEYNTPAGPWSGVAPAHQPYQYFTAPGSSVRSVGPAATLPEPSGPTWPVVILGGGAGGSTRPEAGPDAGSEPPNKR
jgi:hypothetical protein